MYSGSINSNWLSEFLPVRRPDTIRLLSDAITASNIDPCHLRKQVEKTRLALNEFLESKTLHLCATLRNYFRHAKSMKLLAYCIVSHNRPHTLESHLASVSSVIHSFAIDQVSLYVFDNSTGDDAAKVRFITSKYSSQLLQTEGASVSNNFGKILNIPDHRFCIIAHDDDSCYINDLTTLLNLLDTSSLEQSLLLELCILMIQLYL